MIEATVDDVLVRVSDTDPERLAWFGRIVLLKEKDGERVLPIWSGPPEADLLFMSLRGKSTPRPMPHDVMAELIRVLDATLERVAITRESDIAYHATLAIAVDGRTADVDARPSDALLLAVRTGSPILVAERILDEHGVQAGSLSETLPARTAQSEVMAAGEWRSLTSELLRRQVRPLRSRDDLGRFCDQVGEPRRLRRLPDPAVVHRLDDVSDGSRHEPGLIMLDVVAAPPGDHVPAVRHERGELVLQRLP